MACSSLFSLCVHVGSKSNSVVFDSWFGFVYGRGTGSSGNVLRCSPPITAGPASSTARLGVCLILTLLACL